MLQQVDEVRKGDRAAIKIVPTNAYSHLAYGRHFDHKDMIYSRITRESINLLIVGFGQVETSYEAVIY